MDCTLEGFDGETVYLPLYFTNRGARLFIGGGCTGTFPDADADVRKIHGLPGVILLLDVQPLPRAIGGATYAGGWDHG